MTGTTAARRIPPERLLGLANLDLAVVTLTETGDARSTGEPRRPT